MARPVELLTGFFEAAFTWMMAAATSTKRPGLRLYFLAVS